MVLQKKAVVCALKRHGGTVEKPDAPWRIRIKIGGTVSKYAREMNILELDGLGEIGRKPRDVPGDDSLLGERQVSRGANVIASRVENGARRCGGRSSSEHLWPDREMLHSFVWRYERFIRHDK
jgi:hypothetical protein